MSDHPASGGHGLNIRHVDPRTEPLADAIDRLTDAPYETVIAPEHYRLPGGIEVFDLIEDMPFCLGSAIKYLLRAGRKPGTNADNDLAKAAFCLERELDRRARAAAKAAPR